jgi:hypothetical protein
MIHFVPTLLSDLIASTSGILNPFRSLFFITPFTCYHFKLSFQPIYGAIHCVTTHQPKPCFLYTNTLCEYSTEFPRIISYYLQPLKRKHDIITLRNSCMLVLYLGLGSAFHHLWRICRFFVWFNVRQHNNGYIDVSFWERKCQLRG